MFKLNFLKKLNRNNLHSKLLFYKNLNNKNNIIKNKYQWQAMLMMHLLSCSKQEFYVLPENVQKFILIYFLL